MKTKSAVDVGCGIGGSSRYLAAKYGAKCEGITLSPFQAQRANALASAQGLADKVIYLHFCFPIITLLLPCVMRQQIYLYVVKREQLQVSFRVADALQQPFRDGQFDLVWSMESGEHMPDKTKVF